MSNVVGWFEIYVNDMKRAKTFYETVFGKPLTRLESPDIEMWAFPMNPDASGATGALVKMAGVSAGGNSTLVYFNCDDCAVEAAKAAAAGGSIQRAKFSIGPYGFIALAVDTEGNMIGLHSMR